MAFSMSKSKKPEIEPGTPKHRMVTIMHEMSKALIGTMKPGAKKFIAEQAYDILSPNFDEAVADLSDEQVTEFTEFGRQAFSRMLDVIEHGLPEGEVSYLENEMKLIGGARDGEKEARHHDPK